MTNARIQLRVQGAAVWAWALLLILPSLVEAVTYSSIFATCAGSGYVPNGGAQSGVWTSASDCAAYCYAKDTSYIYSAWTQTTSGCSCGSNSFQTGAIAFGNPGGCGGNYEVSITHTTYNFETCSNDYNFGGSVIQSNSNDFFAIFQACKAYRYMAIYPTASNTFAYACGSTYTLTSTKTCDYQVNRLYSHPTDATASQLARREQIENSRRLLHLRNQGVLGDRWCPKGSTACRLENDPNSFECVDTMNDLESCGGCMYGPYGRSGVEVGGSANSTYTAGNDCSAMPGVALGHSSCVEGKCQFDCKIGWKTDGKQCVKLKKRTYRRVRKT
ncbi:uncharacterized protein I303_105683 [Kwoniella dejecticola CBS 10117]|uniref:Protein CPL1-like domain-containing protein n=1 Tax=Kwoniella dejecticola CBS 10117 TaxID=1296121 RepID=A0A1A6A039_9TREE|nr:uncharacterized protein I303_05705 [Kwoniella dejecticola CBS 10117]OBR83427.1 hypothetical protein I303_05705 [Kwoniella dejecticola CBS 10117]